MIVEGRGDVDVDDPPSNITLLALFTESEKLMNKRRHVFLWVCIASISLLSTGCIQQITRNMISTMIVDPAFESFLQEDDTYIAWQAIGSQLKLVEILLQKESDTNRRNKLQMLLCQGFASYALLMEPQLREIRYNAQNAENVEQKNRLDLQAQELERRMRRLALRGRDHCFDIIERRYAGFTEAANLGRPIYTELLKRMVKSDAGSIFWAGFAWGYALINGLEDTNLTAQIPQLKQLMHRVVELDSPYFYGGGHIFLATLYSQSPLLGGDLKLAKQHFDQAYTISQRKALLVHFYQARFYSRQNSDTEQCKQLLQQIKDAPKNIQPSINLINVWTKEMAHVALRDVDEFCP
jgi:hypothetical protein